MIIRLPQMINLLIYFKAYIVGYFAAAISMLTIFLVAMELHEAYDYDYLCYAVVHILGLAIPSGVLVAVMYNQHILIKIITGVVVGPITAALYIYLH